MVWLPICSLVVSVWFWYRRYGGLQSSLVYIFQPIALVSCLTPLYLIAHLPTAYSPRAPGTIPRTHAHTLPLFSSPCETAALTGGRSSITWGTDLGYQAVFVGVASPPWCVLISLPPPPPLSREQLDKYKTCQRHNFPVHGPCHPTSGECGSRPGIDHNPGFIIHP